MNYYTSNSDRIFEINIGPLERVFIYIEETKIKGFVNGIYYGGIFDMVCSRPSIVILNLLFFESKAS